MNQPAPISKGRSEALGPADAYDIAAPYYDEWKWQCFWQHAELPLIASEVAAFAKQRTGDSTLLDIGCGTGKYLHRLSRHFRNSIGVDVSERMLAIAAERAPGHELVHAEATDLPLPSLSADLVLSTRMLSHVADPRSALAEMVRVLRPGGFVILSDVAAEHEYEHTRLPLHNGHVYVQTYKHPFSHLVTAAGSVGLTLVRSISITADASLRHACTKLQLRAKGKLGWVAIWRHS